MGSEGSSRSQNSGTRAPREMVGARRGRIGRSKGFQAEEMVKAWVGYGGSEQGADLGSQVWETKNEHLGWEAQGSPGGYWIGAGRGQWGWES